MSAIAMKARTYEKPGNRALSVIVSDDMYDRLTAEAHVQKKSKQELIRLCLAKCLGDMELAEANIAPRGRPKKKTK